MVLFWIRIGSCRPTNRICVLPELYCLSSPHLAARMALQGVRFYLGRGVLVIHSVGA